MNTNLNTAPKTPDFAKKEVAKYAQKLCDLLDVPFEPDNAYIGHSPWPSVYLLKRPDKNRYLKYCLGYIKPFDKAPTPFFGIDELETPTTAPKLLTIISLCISVLELRDEIAKRKMLDEY